MLHSYMQFYALSFHIFIFPTTHFSSFPLQLVLMAAIAWQVELGGAGKKPYVGSQEVCEELTVPMTFILDFIDG